MTKKQDERVIYPSYTCQSPIIRGESSVAYGNLFTHPKKLIVASATISTLFEQKLINKAEKFNYKTNVIEIAENPFKFNVQILKIGHDISIQGIINIINSVDTSKNKIFTVLPTKKRSEALYIEAGKDINLANKLTYFKQQDYTKAYDGLERDQKEDDSKSEVLITYAKSSICRAVDLNFINLVLVDCAMFLPTIALNFNSDDSDNLQSEEINTALTQIIGRVFRSKLPRIEGQTVIDDRNIVILLYNLPKFLQDFQPDPLLLSKYKEYRNEHITGECESQIYENITKSIGQALNGEIITNKSIEQKQIIIEKAKNKGLSALNRRTERELLTDKEVNEIKEYRKRHKN